MTKLRFITSGESHGKGLIAILEGIPSGLIVATEYINAELTRRQQGYGRGKRMKIEQDKVEIFSGVRWGKTIGSPITLFVENRDYKNWKKGMSINAQDEGAIPFITNPRPGHADLAGVLKYGHNDIRNVLERSSARETAARVAAGAISKRFLLEFGITIDSYVIQIGNIKMPDTKNIINIKGSDKSPVRCPDANTSQKMVKLIDKALKNGDSVGGIFKVIANNVPLGLGSYIQWDKRLEANLAMAIMSIHAIKGIEIGLGFKVCEKFGSQAMDEIFYNKKTGFYRKTNYMGGIEGGMSNGMPIVISAVMKPIPTLRKPLQSIDLKTLKPTYAVYERSDTCAVPSASVIAEAMTALVLTDAMLEKFGGDSLKETKRNFDGYIKEISH